MLYPISNKVVIKIVENIGQTAGGVILPDIEQEGTLLGKVEAVGPGIMLSTGKRAPMQVSQSDIVVFPKYSAKKFEVEDDVFYILPENEILTITESDNE